MNKLSVMILFGGDSPEHEVSIRSAGNIYQAIDSSKYIVDLCYIDKQGAWWLLDDWQDDLSPGSLSIQLQASLGEKSFVSTDDKHHIEPDVILPVLHGDNGEDGTVQGLAELMRIPIVGCDVASSAVCWDKILTKQLLAAAGIVVVPYRVHQAGQSAPSFERIVAELGQPVFVKPARSGSSIGVSRVSSTSEFEAAISEASRYSDRILIEQAVIGRELEVGVLGNSPQHQTSGVGEIKAGQDFYSYDDKYDQNSQAEVIISADLSDDMQQSIRRLAHQAYEVLGCRGLSRVDFLLSEDGQAYINEINTFPGFTDISQYPQLWQAAGIEYSQLVDRLIGLALPQNS